MEQTVSITMSVEEFRSVINEEVKKVIKNQLEVQGRIQQLPALLTREEFMKVMHISAPTATKIFDRQDFRVFRQGKLLIETEFLFEWIRKNSDWVEKNTGYFQSVS